MKPITKGNPSASILLVGEYLGPEEVRQGKPFVGYSGVELDKMLHEAGILLSDCFFTNILHDVPDGGSIDNHFFGIRDGKKAGRDLVFGKYPDDKIIEGTKLLHETIAAVNPNLIITLGNTAMWALSGEEGITKWRGSILDCDGRKMIPTFNPAAITRNWPWRFVMVQDFRRAASEAASAEVNYPDWNFLIHPSFETVMDFLDSVDGEIAVDIETRAYHISCIGIATSKTDALCIPLMRVGEEYGYWTKEEETAIIVKLRDVLTKPTVKCYFHNGHYDCYFISYYWGFLPNIGGDTMLMQHVAFPGMSDDTRLKAKALFFVASMYCDFYQFWKDDGKEVDTKVGEEENWVYNSKDCCYTFEAKDALKEVLAAYNLTDQYNFMMDLYPITLDMAIRGLKVDLEYRNRLDGLLLREMTQRQQWIDTAASHPLNPRSPKQMKAFFYDDLKIAPITNRKTKKPTLDDDALEELKKRKPVLRPLIEKIQETRSLNIFRSNFVKANLDTDDRMRFGINITGTETFRLSMSKNSFNIGANMQTIPVGSEED